MKIKSKVSEGWNAASKYLYRTIKFKQVITSSFVAVIDELFLRLSGIIFMHDSRK